MVSSSTMLALCFSFSTQSKISRNQNPLSFPTALSLFLSKANSLKLASSPVLFTKPKFSPIPKFSESQGAVIEAEFDDKAPEPVHVVEATKEEPKREDIYAVVLVGAHQYIVFPGRYIHTQRLKGANVNDKIFLNKVLLVGTKTSTFIGKPIVTNAIVHAVVEEQGLDSKVVVFKYKKKKNYRRNIGHRRPNMRIRMIGITGYQDYPATTLDS